MASIDPTIRMSGLEGEAAFDANRQALRSGCVAANTHTRAYSLSSAQRSGRLRIFWSDGDGAFTALPDGETAHGFLVPPRNADCAGKLRIEVADGGHRGGTLADVVTVMISPL